MTESVRLTPNSEADFGDPVPTEGDHQATITDVSVRLRPDNLEYRPGCVEVQVAFWMDDNEAIFVTPDGNEPTEARTRVRENYPVFTSDDPTKQAFGSSALDWRFKRLVKWLGVEIVPGEDMTEDLEAFGEDTPCQVEIEHRIGQGKHEGRLFCGVKNVIIGD